MKVLQFVGMLLLFSSCVGQNQTLQEKKDRQQPKKVLRKVLNKNGFTVFRIYQIR